MHSIFKKFKSNKQGFTLLEIIVAMGIMVLVVGSMTWLLLFTFRSKDIIWEQLDTQNEGRKIIQDFVNELRTATDSSIGAYTIDTADEQEIIFYSNIDEDSWREKVRYFLDGTTLKKGVTKPTSTPLQYFSEDEEITEVVHDISNGTDPVFYYYDQDFDGSGSPLSSPISVTDIRVVKITLTLEEDPRLSPVPFNIESKVQIRNLKSN